MSQFLKSRWPLLLIIIVFLIFKVPHLSYPFYWDESWSYAPGVKLMYFHGPSMMPNAIDVFYSRGHPLFFYSSYAAWMDLFGNSFVSMHSFSLLISVLLLVLLYEAGLKLFNQNVAIISVLLLVLQVIFFVQSTFVLPEVLIALLALAAIYFYTTEKLFLAGLFLTMLFFTKESGVTVGAVLGIDAFINLFNKKELFKKRLLKFISILPAFILIAIFFVIQKHIKGWYLFPEHAGLVNLKWTEVWYKFRTCNTFLFTKNELFTEAFRIHFFRFLLIVGVITAIIKKDIKYAVIWLPAICIYLMMDDKRAGFLPGGILFSLYILSLFFSVYCLVKIKYRDKPVQSKLLYLLVAFFISYMLFYSLSLIIVRYLLAAMAVLLFLSAVYLSICMSDMPSLVLYPVLAVILIIGYHSYKHNEGHGDDKLGAYDAMIIQQDLVDYMVSNNYYDKNIGVASYQDMVHLNNPNTGFLHTNKVFNNVGWDINNNTDFVLFDNIEINGNYDRIKNDTTFHLVKRYQKGDVWGEIYSKNK